MQSHSSPGSDPLTEEVDPCSLTMEMACVKQTTMHHSAIGASMR